MFEDSYRFRVNVSEMHHRIYYVSEINFNNIMLTDERGTIVNIPLALVDKDTLEEKRNSGKPGIVIKLINVRNKLLYAAIPNSIDRIGYAGGKARGLIPYICPRCKRQRACSYKEGGCQKVCDGYLIISRTQCSRYANPIEKYPYILEGYEVFNTSGVQHLIVTRCMNFIYDMS